MRPGKLDQRISIQRYVETSDGMGGDVLDWDILKTTWANVKPASGREREFAEQLTSEYTNIFTIRNTNTLSLTEADKIVWNGDNYNIRSVAKAGARKMYLLIAAERGVAQ